MAKLIRLAKAVHLDREMTDDPAPDGFPEGSSSWRVRLTYQGRQASFPFFTGPSAGGPDAYTVLDCLLSDTNLGDQSFEDFCGELGYDTDSRKAEAAWKGCQEHAPKVRELLGDDFDTFNEAER